jgi:hypothetical protein
MQRPCRVAGENASAAHVGESGTDSQPSAQCRIFCFGRTIPSNVCAVDLLPANLLDCEDIFKPLFGLAAAHVDFPVAGSSCE